MPQNQGVLAMSATTPTSPKTIPTLKISKNNWIPEQSLAQRKDNPIDTLILLITHKSNELDEKTKQEIEILKSSQTKLTSLNPEHKISINKSLQKLQRIELKNKTIKKITETSNNNYIIQIQEAMFQTIFNCQIALLENIKLITQIDNLISCLTNYIFKKDLIKNLRKSIKQNPLNKQEQDCIKIIKQEFKTVFFAKDTFEKLINNPLFYEFINNTTVIYIPYTWLIHTAATKEQQKLLIENIKLQNISLTYEITYDLYIYNQTNPDYKELFERTRHKAKNEIKNNKVTKTAKAIEYKLDHLFINSNKILEESYLKSLINLKHLNAEFQRTATLPITICIKNIMTYIDKKIIEQNPNKKPNHTIYQDWETYKQTMIDLPDSITKSFTQTIHYTKNEITLINTILQDYNKLLRYDLLQSIPTGDVVPLINDYHARGMIDFFVQIYIDSLESKIYKMFLDNIDLFIINKPKNFEILPKQEQSKIIEKETNLINFFAKLTYEECHHLLTKRDAIEPIEASIWQKIYNLFPNKTFYIQSNLDGLIKNPQAKNISTQTKIVLELLSYLDEKDLTKNKGNKTKKNKSQKKKRKLPSPTNYQLSDKNNIKAINILNPLSIQELEHLLKEINQWKFFIKHKSTPLKSMIESVIESKKNRKAKIIQNIYRSYKDIQNTNQLAMQNKAATTIQLAIKQYKNNKIVKEQKNIEILKKFQNFIQTFQTYTTRHNLNQLAAIKQAQELYNITKSYQTKIEISNLTPFEKSNSYQNPETKIIINNSFLTLNPKKIFLKIGIKKENINHYQAFLKTQYQSWHNWFSNLSKTNKNPDETKWDLIYQTACFILLEGHPFCPIQHKNKIFFIKLEAKKISNSLDLYE